MDRLDGILQRIEEVMARLRQVEADPLATKGDRLEILIEAYAAHGSPFGSHLTAIGIWGICRQQTTPN